MADKVSAWTERKRTKLESDSDVLEDRVSVAADSSAPSLPTINFEYMSDVNASN